MKIVVATSIGKNREGLRYTLFPSRWSLASQFHADAYYPYDLAYLSSMLKQQTGHRVKMIDGNFLGYTINKYSQILIEEQPDLIVMEADSLTYLEDMEMLRQIKAAIPVQLLLCGPYPTYAPEQALRDGADWVALGEFQKAVVDLVKSGMDPDTRGIYPNGRADLFDINQLPLPENDDICRREYSRIYACENRELEVFPTRGCPVNCNYCVARNVYYASPKFRVRRVSSVLEEIWDLKTRYPELEGIFFNEESHTSNRAYSLELCEALIRNGPPGFHYECMTNYSALDRQLLEAMRDTGYYKVRIGIETMDADNHAKIFAGQWKKDTNRMMQVLRDCRELGIKIYGTFTVGTYGASAVSDLQTLKNLKQLYQDGLLQDFQVSINTPMPGTPFFDLVKENGWLVTDDISQQNGFAGSVVSFPDYPKEQIDEVFSQFTAFRHDSFMQNRAKGINYSMYDEVWVSRVLQITKECANYD